MDLGLNPEQEAFRQEVRALLRGREAQGCLRAIEAAPRRAEPDGRPLYRLLGARRLLAPHWPRDLGGLGLGGVEAAIVAEELGLHGVPDTLHVLSVQIAGQLLLRAGTEEQRARLLPGMARGDTYCTVLYTEPEAGSDLAALQARAVATGAGFRLSGRKVYNPKTSQAQLGLCAARAEGGAGRYAGLTLFVVPLDRPGVTVRPVACLAPEQFHEVTLDEVEVGAADVVGEVGGGWSLITSALPLERTGMDAAGRGRRWLDRAARALLDGDETGDEMEALGRLGAAVEASRLLAWRAMLAACDGRLDDATAAMTKWYTTTTAQQVAWWAAGLAGLAGSLTRDDPEAPGGGGIELAAAEAPGLSLSAGTSEMMLQIVASGLRPPEG